MAFDQDPISFAAGTVRQDSPAVAPGRGAGTAGDTLKGEAADNLAAGQAMADFGRVDLALAAYLEI